MRIPIDFYHENVAWRHKDKIEGLMFMRSRHSVATGMKHRQPAFCCVLPGKGTNGLDAWPRKNIQPVALIFILFYLSFYFSITALSRTAWKWNQAACISGLPFSRKYLTRVLFYP